MRYYGNLTTLPIRYVVDTPLDWIHTLSGHMRQQRNLIKENAMLRANMLLLQAKLHEVMTLNQNNLTQTALAKAAHKNKKTQFISARLLAIKTHPFYQIATLNLGHASGVYEGQAVIDGYGIVGQIVQSGIKVSQVLMVTDIRSKIPVQVSRTGLRAVVQGLGYRKALKLLHVADTQDVQPGDLLVTSGFGGHYPQGFPVGYVESVHKNTGHYFADIAVMPAAHLEQGKQFLLIKKHVK